MSGLSVAAVLFRSALESELLITKPWKDPSLDQNSVSASLRFQNNPLQHTLPLSISFLTLGYIPSQEGQEGYTPTQAFVPAPLSVGTKFPFQRHVNTKPQEMNQTYRQESCWKKIRQERGNALSIHHLHVTVLFCIPTPSCSIQVFQGFSHLSCLQRVFRIAPARPGFISNNY